MNALIAWPIRHVPHDSYEVRTDGGPLHAVLKNSFEQLPVVTMSRPPIPTEIRVRQFEVSMRAKSSKPS